MNILYYIIVNKTINTKINIKETVNEDWPCNNAVIWSSDWLSDGESYTMNFPAKPPSDNVIRIFDELTERPLSIFLEGEVKSDEV